MPRPSPQTAALTLWQMLQIGHLARQTVRLRLALWRAEMRSRSRSGAMAAVALGLAGALALAMLGLLLAALAVTLHQAGHSLPAALVLTALVAGVAMGVLVLIARVFLRRALAPPAD